MQQGLLVDGDPCRRITGDQVTIEHPDGQLLYFEVASFKRARLDDVNHIIRSTEPEDADGTWECNCKWVRAILGKLVAGRILSRNKADKILFKLEMSCTEIQFHLQRFEIGRKTGVLEERICLCFSLYSFVSVLLQDTGFGVIHR